MDEISSRSEDTRLQIEKLIDIDKDIASLIRFAGQAVQAATSDSATTTSLDARKEHFAQAASQYFELLATIDVRLRQQIHSLKSANIIVEGSSSRTAKSAPTKGTNVRRTAITEDGCGNLDIGLLNSRNDRVGKAMEAELWEKALFSVPRKESRLNELD